MRPVQNGLGSTSGCPSISSFARLTLSTGSAPKFWTNAPNAYLRITGNVQNARRHHRDRVSPPHIATAETATEADAKRAAEDWRARHPRRDDGPTRVWVRLTGLLPGCQVPVPGSYLNPQASMFRKHRGG